MRGMMRVPSAPTCLMLLLVGCGGEVVARPSGTDASTLSDVFVGSDRSDTSSDASLDSPRESSSRTGLLDAETADAEGGDSGGACIGYQQACSQDGGLPCCTHLCAPTNVCVSMK